MEDMTSEDTEFCQTRAAMAGPSPPAPRPPIPRPDSTVLSAALFTLSPSALTACPVWGLGPDSEP